MKKFILFVVALFVSFTFLCQNLFYFKASSIYPDIKEHVVTTSNYFFEDESLIIIGNNNHLTSNYIKELLNDLGNRLLFIYDFDLSDNFNTSLNEAQNNVSMYYLINGVITNSTYSSNTENVNELKGEILDYYKEKYSKIVSIHRSAKMSLENIDDSKYSVIYQGEDRINQAPYGYIDYQFVVKKFRYSNVTSLYLIETKSSFTPGYVAKNMGNTNYDRWQNWSGYVTVFPKQTSDPHSSPGIVRYGGTPKLKDAWPINAPGMISITSSIQLGATFGYSFKNGFGEKGLAIEQGQDYGANLVWSYQKQYTTTEPAVTTQRSADNFNKYEWYYQYSEKRIETHHLVTGVLFEMNSTNQGMCEGDFELEYSHKMVIKKIDLIFVSTETVQGTKIRQILN